jgi:hypothetical protein
MSRISAGRIIVFVVAIVIGIAVDALTSYLF